MNCRLPWSVGIYVRTALTLLEDQSGALAALTMSFRMREYGDRQAGGLTHQPTNKLAQTERPISDWPVLR